MDCKGVEIRLGAYLDGELGGVEMMAVRKHLTHCKACEELLDHQRAVKLALAGLPNVQPQTDFEERLCRRVAMASGPNLTLTRKPAAWAVVAIAAGLLATVWSMRGGAQGAVAQQPALDQPSFEVARHQADMRRSDPLAGDSGILLVNYGK